MSVQPPAAPQPTPRQETRDERLLRELGTNPNRVRLFEYEQEDLLDSLGTNPNRKELTREEYMEIFNSLQ